MADSSPLALPNAILRDNGCPAADGLDSSSLDSSRRDSSQDGSESRIVELRPDGNQWIVAAQAGDEAAFTRLYLDVQPRLLRYAIGLAGPDAEEVTAEAWLQIVRDLAEFTGDLDAFRGWAARIVRNRAIDAGRARARRPVETRGLPEAVDRRTARDTADLVLDDLATAWAVELITRLPADQAEAVLLRAVVGLDAKAAAAVLGKRAGAVRVAAHRGLKTLARMLAEGDAPAPSDRRWASDV